MSASSLPDDATAAVLDAIVDRSGVGVAAWDHDLRFVFVNDLTASINGLAPEDHLGRGLDDVAPTFAATARPILQSVLDGEAPLLNVERSVSMPSGESRQWVVSYVPFFSASAPSQRYVAAVYVEVTDRVAERRRLESLALLSHAMNSAETVDDVGRLVVRHGPAVVGARFVNMAVLDADQRFFTLVQPPLDPDIEQRWRTLPLDAPRTPFHEAIETRRPVHVDRARRAEEFAHMVADNDRVGLESTAAYPLLSRGREPIGAVGIGWTETIDFDEATVARLALLADICSQTLQRVQRTELRNELVVDLQNEVLSTLDTPEGLDVAVSYAPARHELGFGGDWYDVISLDSDHHVFVVGDVAGHGSHAAARMTATKATIRALARTVSPPEVVPATTRALDHLRSGYVATVGLAWIHQADGTLAWSLAGHPPPILRTAGRTDVLAGDHHPPIGTPGRRHPLPTVPFPPGSLLVLYTDGLVERRGVDIDVSIEALRRRVSELAPGSSASDARDVLLEDFADGSDDIALVVIRRPAPDD